MWGGQDKGSPIWCLLDKAAESEVDGRPPGGFLLICHLAVDLSDNDAFKARWKTALSFTVPKHATNGAAAADPTLETSNILYRVLIKAGITQDQQRLLEVFSNYSLLKKAWRENQYVPSLILFDGLFHFLVLQKQSFLHPGHLTCIKEKRPQQHHLHSTWGFLIFRPQGHQPRSEICFL